MIEAKKIIKFYGELQVLKGVDLHIKEGEVIAIVGPSGAGKTTLLQILGTLDTPDITKDSILHFNGNNILELSDKYLSRFRNEHIGFIFQFHQLLPEFTALENVCIPAFIGKKPKNEVIKEAKKLLDFLGLSDRIDHKPNELSGGEQQRVAVARALINKPKVIFADEPSGNLDSASAKSLHELFFKLRDEFNQTFVIVTHNEKLADMADRKLIMNDGMIMNGSSANNSTTVIDKKDLIVIKNKSDKKNGWRQIIGGIGALIAGSISIFFKSGWNLITGIPLLLLGLFLLIFGLIKVFKKSNT